MLLFAQIVDRQCLVLQFIFETQVAKLKKELYFLQYTLNYLARQGWSAYCASCYWFVQSMGPESAPYSPDLNPCNFELISKDEGTTWWHFLWNCFICSAVFGPCHIAGNGLCTMLVTSLKDSKTLKTNTSFKDSVPFLDEASSYIVSLFVFKLARCMQH